MNRMVKKFMVVLLSAFMFLGAVTTPVQAKGDSYPTSIFDWFRLWQQPQPEEPTEPAPEETPAETEKPAEETKEEAAETEQPAEEAKEEAAETEQPAEEAKEEAVGEPAAPETTEETVQEPAETPVTDGTQVEADAEETPAADSMSYPAAVLVPDQQLENIAVTVDAPEGALPEGTTMTVKKVPLEAVQNAVDNTADVEGIVVAAVDITFYDANGSVVEPIVPITVTMTAKEIENLDNLQVVHVDTTADEIENAEVEAEAVEAKNEDDTVTFDAEHFSVYAIVDGSTQEGDYRATYYFQNADGTPYYFKDKAGKDVDNQILKNGETLEDVGVPDVDVTDETFNGWYYWTDAEGYGSQVTFGAVTVTGNDTIYVRANVGTVHYVTFYEDAEGTIILDRIQLGQGATYDISQKTVPAPESELAFVGWNETAGTNDDEREAITATTITVDSDKTYYPVFKKAHWIHFSSAPVGSGATYIAPAYVLAGKSASDAKPSDPTWKGHRFLGWATSEDTDYETEGSFDEFNFNQVLSSDVTLYAQWTAAEATYTVQYWKQNVTDNKNADDSAKNYSFAEQITRTATAGSTVSPIAEDMNKPSTDPNNYKGFVYNANKSDSSFTVNADGTTVINVYYDRQLITFKFYKNGNSTDAPGYNNGYYNTTTGNDRVTVYTGLYGQTLQQNGYSWPSYMYTYYYGSNHSNTMGMSFLGEFVPNSYMGDDTEIRFYYSGARVAVVEFYLQNVDGTYPSTPFATGNLSGGGFSFTEKYEAYNVVSYRRYTGNHNWYDTSWRSCKDGDTENGMSYTEGWGWNAQTRYYSLAVRYQRKTHTLKYLDSVDGTALSGIQSARVVYGASLSDKAPSSSYVPVSSTPGKVWDGKWYKDQACTEEFDWNETMPNADMNVYAGWKDVYYWIKVDPNGGEIHGTQSTYFWETYGKKVEEYGNATREYVEDSNGTFYYHYDEFNENDPDGTQPATRKAYYTENASEASSSTKYSYEKNAYALIGWYDITNGEDNAAPYKFGTPITHNLILQARWRRVGEYRVVYEAAGYIKAEDGTLTQDLSLVGTNNPTDNNRYADKSDSSILSAMTAPTGYVFVGWYFEDQAKNPGEVFKVHAEDADENKTIHIYPIFQKYDAQPVPVTHIDFYANYQDAAGLPINGVNAQNEGKYSYENVQINAGYDIISVATAIAKGTADKAVYENYEFLGWAKDRNATADDLFLKYEDGQFKAQSNGEWVAVTQVGADEELPYDDLYAVWQGKFYVYHSGVEGGNLETIKYTSTTYDLTATPEGLTANTLYGGYYLEGGFTAPAAVNEKIPAYDGDNWTWTAAQKVSGKAITPVAGTTYYIKEVPADKFLQPYTHYTYYKANGNISKIWMMSAIDDAMYEETGFVILDKNNTANVCKSLTVKNQVGGASVKLTAKKVFKLKGTTDNDYLTYLANVIQEGNSVVQYWVTPDKLIVTGTTQRNLTGITNKNSITPTDESVSSTINEFTN